MDSQNVNNNNNNNVHMLSNITREMISDTNIAQLSWQRVEGVITKSMVIELLTNDDAVDDWAIEKIKDKVFQQASFWICVLEVIDSNLEMTYKFNIPKIMENLLLSCGNTSSFIRKVKSLMSKIIKKQDVSILDNQVIGRPIEFNLGVECQKNKITEEWLANPREIIVQHVTRKLILELRLYRLRNNICYKQCALWVKYLCNLTDVPNIGNLRLTWERINNKKLAMKTTEKYQDYLNGIYEPPKLRNEIPVNKYQEPKILKPKQNTINQDFSKCTKKTHSYLDIRRQKFNAQFQLYQMRKENNKLAKQLQQTKLKLAILSTRSTNKTRNANKRVKRRDKIILSLTQEMTQCNKSLLQSKKKVHDIKQKYKTQAVLFKYYKELRQNSKKDSIDITQIQKSTKDINTELLAEKKMYKEQVLWLENKNEELKEKIDKLMNNKEIITFQNGKYTDEVREVYASLLASNVGVKNVDKIVKLVLAKLGNVNVDRLPKKTFSEMMLVEAKAIAQLQCAEAILNSDSICTLHTDGTKRDGKEYGGVQIGTQTGQLSLGISEILQGNTDSFLKMIKDMFKDIALLAGDSETEKNIAVIISKIKNMMTDRHVVNDSLKSALEKWKNDCLPLVIENFKSFSSEIQTKFVEINHFKCNLHVLVNLGTQAETALKQWEKSVLLTESNSGSLNFSTSTSDFIRATTKLCVPGADQKSGYGLSFLSHLESLNPPVPLQMSTFHGHRINIIFSMGASVFYHRKHIQNFVDTYFSNSTKNNLVSCVSNYIGNNVYLAGCRALGIVDKLLTGPLWRQIESTKHILDLNNIWFTVLNYLEIFSNDSSELLEGKPLYPNFTSSNHVYDALFNVEDEELNILTIEALQILCTNFLIIIHRQLGDYLPGGKFHQDCDNFDELKKQSSCVSATNIVSERDFANLDRLRREKPNANTIALEGIILFSNNKTLKWLEEMDSDKKSKIIETARIAAPRIIQDFRNRKSELRQKRIDLIKQKKEDNLKIQKQKNDEIIKLGTEIQKHGGIWKSVDEVNKNLRNISNAQKLEAVKCQIKYRKIVLKDNPQDKTWFQFSSNRKIFSLEELVHNLKQHITISCVQDETSQSSDEQMSIGDSTYRIKNKNERELFMREQREMIIKKIQEIKQKYKAKMTSGTENIPDTSVDNMADIETSKSATASKPKKLKQTRKSCTHVNTELPEVVLHKFTIGQTVAIAYSDSWFPGQVLQTLGEDKATIKFLHWCSKTSDFFRWPDKDDLSDVENLFVFGSDFEINPRDSSGRTWTIPDISLLKTKYSKFCELYFT